MAKLSVLQKLTSKKSFKFGMLGYFLYLCTIEVGIAKDYSWMDSLDIPDL